MAACSTFWQQSFIFRPQAISILKTFLAGEFVNITQIPTFFLLVPRVGAQVKSQIIKTTNYKASLQTSLHVVTEQPACKSR